jgi:hypothetical protein
MRKKIILLLLLLGGLSACELNFILKTPTSTLQEMEETGTVQLLSTATPSKTIQAEVTPTLIPSLYATATTVPAPSPIPTATTIAPPPVPLPGLHIHDINSPGQASLGKNSGAAWTRFDDFNWDEIEPLRRDPPEYRWEVIDETALETIAEGDYEIIGIVLFTPPWAQKYPGIACGPIAEGEFNRFAQFMSELVSRYGKPPYSVKYWEIGNEPDVGYNTVPAHNGFGCWGEDDDPYFGGGYYGEMLKAVYPAIKGADPEAQVLVGGLLLDCDPVNTPDGMDCTPSRFIEGILEADGGDYFDGISFHAYDYFFGNGTYGNVNWNSHSNTTGPVVTAKTEYLKSVLERYGYPSKYLLNTEAAVLCGRDGMELGCQQDDFIQTKSNYIASSNIAASALGLSANFWYSLTGWRGSGLVQPPGLAMLPSYDAYRFNADQLLDAQYVRKLDEYDGVLGYEFEKDGAIMWVMWSLDGDDHMIVLPQNPIAVFDVYGAPLAFGNSLLVTLSPVYIMLDQ